MFRVDDSGPNVEYPAMAPVASVPPTGPRPGPDRVVSRQMKPVGPGGCRSPPRVKGYGLVAVPSLSMVSAVFSRQVAGMLFCAGLVLV
jgi:hypothetical protein